MGIGTMSRGCSTLGSLLKAAYKADGLPWTRQNAADSEMGRGLLSPKIVPCPLQARITLQLISQAIMGMSYVLTLWFLISLIILGQRVQWKLTSESDRRLWTHHLSYLSFFSSFCVMEMIIHNNNLLCRLNMGNT